MTARKRLTNKRIKALMPKRSGTAPSNIEAVRRGLTGPFRSVWTEPAMYEFARAIEAEVTSNPKEAS